MGLVEIMAFLKALPLLVESVNRLVSGLDSLRMDAVNASLDSYKKEVNEKITKLVISKDDNERKAALIELAKSLGK